MEVCINKIIMSSIKKFLVGLYYNSLMINLEYVRLVKNNIVYIYSTGRSGNKYMDFLRECQ